MNHLPIKRYLSKLFVFVQALLPQHALSRWLGRLADAQIPWVKNPLIKTFVRVFNVDLSEAQQENYKDYPSFNAFFTRALVDGARPIDSGAALCAPSDGMISQIGMIHHQRLLQAKGKDYALHELLADQGDGYADQFSQGQFMTIYLSPRDYHRVHVPCDGRLVQTRYIPGRLFSVNDATTQNLNALFSRNQRLVCCFETDYGPMALVLVGAMIVGSIETPWAGDYFPDNKDPEVCNYSPDTNAEFVFKKGDELARFKLGSTVILVTAFADDFKSNNLQPGDFIQMGLGISAS